MNFIIKSSRVTPGSRPLHHQRLSVVLGVLEVQPKVVVSWTNANYDNRFAMYRATEPHLWDYLEQARNNHRRLILQHHPDRGGCHEMAALINSAWQRVKELLARKGVAYG